MSNTPTPAPQSAPAAASPRVSPSPTRRRYVPPVFAPTNLRLVIPADELARLADLRVENLRAFRAAYEFDEDTAPGGQREASRLWAEWERISEVYWLATIAAKEIYASFRLPPLPMGPNRRVILPEVAK